MFKSKKINTGSVESLVGKNSFYEGKLTASGIVRIDGKFEGSLEVEGELVVGESADIRAEVKASNMMLAGTLKGNAHIEQKLELSATGRLEGDIRAKTLIIAEGGIFHGTSLTLEEGVEEKE